LKNVHNVKGSQNDELPLVRFDLTLRGGQLLDALDRVGVANLTATLLNRGTAKHTRADLEMAIEELGASISIQASGENIHASGSTLARNYAPTIALLTEMLLEPRWDEAEFELAKLSASNEINAQLSDPNSIARNQYRHLIYGDEHVLSRNKLGTIETIEAITLDDLRHFYANSFSPSIANLHIVGAIAQEDALGALSAIEDGWAQSNVEIPDYKIPDMPESSQVYIYDVPGAKQSVLYFGYPALAETDDDYYPARILNYILGGGSFASRLTQELRERKGYTYGIRSSFSGSTRRGPFTISSNVRSNVTLESALLIKDILEQYGDTFSTADLDVTKNFMLKSKARSFETLAAKIGLLQDLSAYGWPYDYVKDQDEIIRAMTIERIQELAAKYIRPDRMIYLVVGDAESQYERLSRMGFGDAIKLN
jgi:zinc protease